MITLFLNAVFMYILYMSDLSKTKKEERGLKVVVDLLFAIFFLAGFVYFLLRTIQGFNQQYYNF